ncbi:MAG: hypothetical protein LBQ86_02960 [Holophagales bacterium]|jgi:hypothetical protein|nr:hypothetical protein [Holophagales bacterium]
MNTNTRQVKVDSAQSMELMISSYIAQGFAIAYRGEKITTLRKPKKFRAGLAVLLFILYVIPFIIYIIVYASKPDAEAVEIIVSPEETPKISYSPAPQTMAPNALESPKNKLSAVHWVHIVCASLVFFLLVQLVIRLAGSDYNTRSYSAASGNERTSSITNQKTPAQKMIAAREGFAAKIFYDAKSEGLNYKIYTEGLISDTLVFEHPLYANRNTVRDLQLSASKDVLRNLGFKNVKVTDGKAVYLYAVSDL